MINDMPTATAVLDEVTREVRRRLKRFRWDGHTPHRTEMEDALQGAVGRALDIIARGGRFRTKTVLSIYIFKSAVGRLRNRFRSTHLEHEQKGQFWERIPDPHDYHAETDWHMSVDSATAGYPEPLRSHVRTAMHEGISPRKVLGATSNTYQVKQLRTTIIEVLDLLGVSRPGR